MPSEALPGLPGDVFRDLAAWLRAGTLPAVVIGGVAASLLSRPRVTRDVDVVVLAGKCPVEGLIAQASEFGFVPRLTDAAAFAQKSRVLLLRHQATAIDVDVSLGILPFEQEMISRSRPIQIGDACLPLPTPEDLIITKAVAGRTRDMADIEALIEAHPELDRRRVRTWVRAFAEALEIPEMFSRLDALLSRR